MHRAICILGIGLLLLAGCGDSKEDGVAGRAITPAPSQDAVVGFPPERGESTAECRTALRHASAGIAEPDASLEACETLVNWVSSAEQNPKALGAETLELEHLADLCKGRDYAPVCGEAIEAGLLDATGADRPIARQLLKAAAEACGIGGALADKNSSLHMEVLPHVRSKELLEVLRRGNPNAVSLEELSCALSKTEMPDHVQRHIDGTRALDGQQTAEWGSFSARWSYHPDDGLKMTLVESAS